MKTVILMLSLVCVPLVAQVPDPPDRITFQIKRTAKQECNPRYQNYTYSVIYERRYIRIERKLYKELWRTTYNPYGCVVRRVFIKRNYIRKL